MHKAAREGDLRTAEWLLSCGVSSQAKDVDGNSPSHYACREGQVEMQRFLEGTAGGATASFEANKLGVVPVSMLVDSQERKRLRIAELMNAQSKKTVAQQPKRQENNPPPTATTVTHIVLDAAAGWGAPR